MTPPSFRGGPVAGIFSAQCVNLLLAAWGAARLTRKLLPDVGAGPQVTAALVFGAGGPMLSLVSHWHHLAAAALIPG